MTQEIVELVSSTDEKCMSFAIHYEDHTLGNALRHVIMKNPDVEFCGYTSPHPSEPKIHIRIQTVNGTAIDALKKGLNDLSNCALEVYAQFEEALKSGDYDLRETA